MHSAAILVVDDEKTILDSLKGQLRILFGARFTYETAADAAEAWEVLDTLHDDGIAIVVVVSDWLMPGQRGDEFLEHVRSRFPAIGRILLTGQADPAAIARVRQQAIVSDVLYKPWTEDGLRRAIETAAGGPP